MGLLIMIFLNLSHYGIPCHYIYAAVHSVHLSNPADIMKYNYSFQLFILNVTVFLNYCAI